MEQKKETVMKTASWCKIGVLIVTLLGTAAWAAPTDWNDLKGCYSTVSFNGQSPGGPDTEFFGNAQLEENFGYATMPGVDHIRSFEFMLLKYKQGDTFYGDMAWIFLDYGTDHPPKNLAI